MGEGIDLATMRAALKSQYHAALAMLKEAIEACPDELWLRPHRSNAFWQVAYHAIFFAHFYLHRTHDGARFWPGHRADSQNPDGIAGPPDPASDLPLQPPPYRRAEALAFWAVCDAFVDRAVDEMDLLDPQCGFPWYKVSKLEHQLVSLRHVQHHAAQLSDRLRAEVDHGVLWVGARPIS